MSTDTQEAEHRFVDDVHVELDESSASKQQQEALEELRTAVAASRSALTAGVADIRTAVKAYNVHDIWSAVKRRNEEGQRETAHAQLRRAMETCAKVGADLTHLNALSTEANVKLLQEAAELDQTLCRCEETTAIVPPILEELQVVVRELEDAEDVEDDAKRIEDKLRRQLRRERGSVKLEDISAAAAVTASKNAIAVSAAVKVLAAVKLLYPYLSDEFPEVHFFIIWAITTRSNKDACEVGLDDLLISGLIVYHTLKEFEIYDTYARGMYTRLKVRLKQQGEKDGSGDDGDETESEKPYTALRLVPVCTMRNIQKEGVAHLHSLSIVHGNLKPSNLLLENPKHNPKHRESESAGHRPHALVADWGLFITSPNSMRRTGYMAPEVVEAAKTFASDMYAVGCIIADVVHRCVADGKEQEEFAETLKKLVKTLKSEDPAQRPSASEVLQLPCFQRFARTSTVPPQAAQWSWQRDDGGYSEYDATSNAAIEAAYVRFRDARIQSQASTCDDADEAKGSNTDAHAAAGGAGAGADAAATDVGAGAGPGAPSDSKLEDNAGDDAPSSDTPAVTKAAALTPGAVSISQSPHTVVMFTSMTQATLPAGTHRTVKRSVHMEYSFPVGWPSHRQNFRVVRLDDGTSEWSEAVRMLETFVPDASLVSLDRVQNRFVWEQFQHEKRLLTAQLQPLGSDTDVNEKLLWHGTNLINPLNICRQLEGVGFETGSYGCGAYFAETGAERHANFMYKVASQKGRATYQLILARVLCGVPHDLGTVVNESTKTLSEPPHGCHSVCGGTETSRSWVVYQRTRVYPAFIVTYCV